MDYSDYVKIYDVYTSAGIAAEDTRATQVAKIADWINTDFSDIVTAETEDDLRVRVIDNKVRAGFGWGGTSEAQCFRYKYVSATASTYTSNSDCTYMTYPIESLRLFVCRTDDIFVMDFVHQNNTSYAMANTPCYMRFSTDEGKCIALEGVVTNNSSGASIYTIAENQMAYNSSLYSSSYGINNTGLKKTLLTRFTPYYENVVANGVYIMKGAIPETMSIFGLNGVKYLSLEIANYNNGHPVYFALKL